MVFLLQTGLCPSMGTRPRLGQPHSQASAPAWERGHGWGSLIPRPLPQPGNEAMAGAASFPGLCPSLGTRPRLGQPHSQASAPAWERGQGWGSLIPRPLPQPGNEAKAGAASFPGLCPSLGTRLTASYPGLCPSHVRYSLHPSLIARVAGLHQEHYLPHSTVQSFRHSAGIPRL